MADLEGNGFVSDADATDKTKLVDVATHRRGGSDYDDLPLLASETRGTWATIKYTVWLFCLCFSLAGVQFIYSIQFAVGGPLFSQKLKVSNSMIAIILSTAGPISGFVVQPIVGVVSDNCTFRFGRRRIFILGGALLAVLGMGIIGFSAYFGKWCGDDPDGKSVGDHYRGLIFAIGGLWLMNVAVNVMQGPARALVTDVVDADKQQMGNAMVSNTMGLAAIVANVVGAQFLTTSEPYMYMFSMGMGFVLFSIVPTLLVAGEKPYVRPADEKRVSVLGVFIKIYKGFRTMTFPMFRVVFVFFLCWCGYSPFMIYITTFFGKNVEGGDPDHSKDVYQRGVKYGMYGTAGFALLSLLYSLVLPYLVNSRIPGLRFTYFVTQCLQTACFLLFLWFDQLWVALLLTSLVGINFTAFNSIPYALFADLTAGKDAGMYMGVLNSASVVAQTVTNSLASPIITWQDQNVKYGIAFGGIFAGVAALLVWFLPVKQAEEARKRELSPDKERLLSADDDSIN